MKCPKCSYLGFETGDRCRHCGYDFSLLASPAEPDIDVELAIRPTDDTLPATVTWDDHFDAEPLTSPAMLELGDPMPTLSLPPSEPGASGPSHGGDRKLPLFSGGFGPDGDEPLIKLPAAPRAPLAVRRTPAAPRLRAVPRPSSVDVAPALEFAEDVEIAPPADMGKRLAPARVDGSVPREDVGAAPTSGAAARLSALALDLTVLGGVDIVVLYFTLRMASLPPAGIADLPAAPLVVFLLLVKVAYFAAFTAVGGQTIGKMALHIRVVTCDDGPIDGATAVTRTMAGLLSAASLGLGYLPALFGSQRRSLHDRLAGTRVIALSA